MAGKDESPKLTSLKELMPLKPWMTPAPPFSQNPYDRYVKVKKMRGENGKRVYWAAKSKGDDEEEAVNIKNPYGKFFDFVDMWMIKKVHQWIDKSFGELIRLPKHDPYSEKPKSIRGPE